MVPAGVGRAARNGLNFTERGFGVRAALGCSDRGHTAVSQLKPGDIDWDEIFGKPASPDDARRMLRLLSGATHEVHTGLAIIRRPGAAEAVVEEATRVTFAPLSDNEIDAYIATGEPFDKAGAYGIQGIGGRFVTRIEGCYFNVMGLPLARLWVLLREFGWKESTES